MITKGDILEFRNETTGETYKIPFDCDISASWYEYLYKNEDFEINDEDRVSLVTDVYLYEPEKGCREYYYSRRSLTKWVEGRVINYDTGKCEEVDWYCVEELTGYTMPFREWLDI